MVFIMFLYLLCTINKENKKNRRLKGVDRVAFSHDHFFVFFQVGGGGMLRTLLSMATSSFLVVDLEIGLDRFARWAPRS